MAYSAGQALLQIVPSFKGVADSIDAEATKWGESAGQFFGDAFNAQMEAITGESSPGPDDGVVAEKGDRSGAEFADAFSARVDAELQTLPDAAVGLDSTEAEVKIGEVKASLESIGHETVNIDVNEGSALGEIAVLKTALADVGASGGVGDLGIGASEATPEIESLSNAALGALPDLAGLYTYGILGAEGLEKLGPAGAGAGEGLAGAALSAEDAGKALAEMGLAIEGESGTLYTLTGNVTTADALLRRFGLTLDEGSISAADFYSQMDEVQGVLADVQAKAGGAGGGISGIGKDATSAAGDSGSGVGLLLGSILTLGPALLDTASIGIGAIGAISAAAFLGTAGLGIFGLAAIGAGAGLKGLEADAKSVYTGWAQQFAPTITTVVHGLVGDLQPALESLTPVVFNVGAELDILGGQAKSALDSPSWHNFTGWLASEAGPAFSSFIGIVGGLGSGLAHMGEVGLPFVLDVEHGLVNLADSFDRFSQSQTFQDWVNWLVANAPKATAVIGDVGHVLAQLLGAAAPVGIAFLDIANPLLKITSDILSLSPPVNSLVIGLVALGVAGNLMGGWLTSGAAALVKFGAELGIVDAEAAASAAADGAGIGAMAPGLLALGPAAAVAVVGIAAIGGWFALASHDAAVAAAAVAHYTASILALPTSTMPQLNTAIAATNAEIKNLTATTALSETGFRGAGRAGSEMETDITAAGLSVKSLTAYETDLHAKQDVLNANLVVLADRFGLSDTAAQSLADTLKIKLNTALTPSDLISFGLALKNISGQAGVAGPTLEAMASASHSSISQMVKDIQGAGSATATSFGTAGSLLQAFSGQTAITGTQISAFYFDTTEGAKEFTANVQSAIKDGFNPQLISQILQAGPAQAGPLLGAMVGNASKSFVDMVNDSISSMGKITQEAVDEARLLQVAIRASNAGITADYTNAVAVQQQIMAQGTTATVQSVAKALGLGVDQVKNVAHEYGLALPDEFNTNAPAAYAAAGFQGSSAAAGIALHTGDVHTSAKGLTDAVHSALVGGIGGTLSDGAGLGFAFGAGLLGTTVGASAAGTAVAGAAQTGFENPPAGTPTAFGLGQSWAGALINGINSQTGPLATSVATLNRIAAGAFGLPAVPSTPGRASGGSVTAGMPYKVGEVGEELFVPDTSGYIVPHSQLKAPSFDGGSSSGGQIVGFNGPVSFNNEADIEGVLRQATFVGKSRRL